MSTNDTFFETLDTPATPATPDNTPTVTNGTKVVVDTDGCVSNLCRRTIHDILVGGSNTVTVHLTPGAYILTMPGFGDIDDGDPVLLLVSDHSVTVSGLGLNCINKNMLFGANPYFESEQYIAKANLIGHKGISFIASKDTKIVPLKDYDSDVYYIHTLDIPYNSSDDSVVYKEVCEFVFHQYNEYLECEHDELEYVFRFIDYVAWYEHGPMYDSRYSWDTIGGTTYLVEYCG